MDFSPFAFEQILKPYAELMELKDTKPDYDECKKPNEDCQEGCKNTNEKCTKDCKDEDCKAECKKGDETCQADCKKTYDACENPVYSTKTLIILIAIMILLYGVVLIV